MSLSPRAIIAIFLLFPGFAYAEDLTCPSSSETQTITGSLSTLNEPNTHIIVQRPCETISFALQFTVQTRGANYSWNVYNTSGAEPTAGANGSCGNSLNENPITCQYSWPFAGSTTGTPWPGTRGPAGRANTLKVKMTFRTHSYVTIDYTITVTRVPRPGYNIGGTSILDGPILTLPSTLSASVHPLEPRQYWDVFLAGSGTLSVTGTVRCTCGSPTNAIMYLRVYDTAGNLRSTIATIGTTSDGSSKPFTSSTFVNPSGSPQVFVVALEALFREIDVTMTITGQSPQLTLYLDVDGNFTTQSLQSDIASYVPGADLSGTSVNLPQSVMLIAAYVYNGQVVTPPTTNAVTFALSNTSAFEGIAMNASDAGGRDDTAPDYELQQATASFGTDGTARVNLFCWDYGGFTTVTATHEAVVASLNLPIVGSNWISDAGWQVGTDHIADTTSNDDDTDAGPPGNLNLGDGLTAFEEYRGFFIGGQHVRLDPAKQDLFIQSSLPESVGYAPALLIKIHNVLATEINDIHDINFRSGNSGAGGAIPGHYAQKALLIIDGGLSTDQTAGGTFPIRPGRVVPSNVWQIKIYTLTIRLISPPNNNTTDIDLPYDDRKTRQTIAHETGHGVTLGDVDANYACPPPAWTVMLSRYFTSSNGQDQWACAWNNIPNVYTNNELTLFALR
jgi:hypothetical protein